MSTALLNLLFAQAVYKVAQDGSGSGSQDRFDRLSKELKTHPLNKEFNLDKEACKSLYSALLPQGPVNPTTAVLEPLLEKLYESYKQHAIGEVQKDESEYRTKLREIEQIERGNWDSELLRELNSDKSQLYQQQQLRLQKQLELQQRQEQEKKIQAQRLHQRKLQEQESKRRAQERTGQRFVSKSDSADISGGSKSGDSTSPPPRTEAAAPTESRGSVDEVSGPAGSISGLESDSNQVSDPTTDGNNEDPLIESRSHIRGSTEKDSGSTKAPTVVSIEDDDEEQPVRANEEESDSRRGRWHRRSVSKDETQLAKSSSKSPRRSTRASRSKSRAARAAEAEQEQGANEQNKELVSKSNVTEDRDAGVDVKTEEIESSTPVSPTSKVSIDENIDSSAKSTGVIEEKLSSGSEVEEEEEDGEGQDDQDEDDEGDEDEDDDEDAEDSSEVEEDNSDAEVNDRVGSQSVRKRKRSSSSPGGSGGASAAAVKRFQTSVAPLLLNISSNKSASFFTQAVNPNDAPNYYDLIYAPTDLKTIKNQVKEGKITSMNELERELERMFANAVMYNSWNSDMSQWAREMQLETESYIAMFRGVERSGRSASGTPVAEDPEAKRRRK